MNSTQPQPLRGRQRGVTLIESCVVLAVAAVSVGIAAPSFDTLRQRHQLEGVAAQLETDIMYTRGLAVARNQTLRLSFSGSRCYVVHSGDAGDCQCAADGTAACSAGAEALRVVRLDDGSPVSLRSNSASIAFDAIKGTVTPTATVQVLAANGAAVRQIVSVMGRVRSCAPAPGLPGYARC